MMRNAKDKARDVECGGRRGGLAVIVSTAKTSGEKCLRCKAKQELGGEAWGNLGEEVYRGHEEVL